MRLLAIDIGNSRLKYCLGNDDSGFPQGSIRSFPINQPIPQLPAADNCVIASVNPSNTERLLKTLGSNDAPNKVFVTAQNCPLALSIQNRETLGADRIAAAIGAYHIKNSGVIVVDSGTATTVDLIDPQGCFRGGCILPGVELAMRSLSRETDQLPTTDSSFHSVPDALGDDTVSAMRSGVFWGQVGAIEKIVFKLRKSFGDLPVVVSGGAGKMLLEASNLKGEYRAGLVLEGLWQFGLTQFSS